MKRGPGVVRVVLVMGIILTVIILAGVVYRSAGYVGVNASYNCVEDTIGYVDLINMDVDPENGYVSGDPLIVAEDAGMYLSEIEGRGQCVSGYRRMMMSTLAEKQEAVDAAAAAYLRDVAYACEMLDVDDVPSQTGVSLEESYTKFLESVDEFEEEVARMEARFFLTSE